MSYTAQRQPDLLQDFTIDPNLRDWTFNGALTRELTHCYHDYPARMIPPIAGQLLEMFGNGAKLLFDPYCGTGTSLVEGMVRGIDVVGTDLNPLARLIAQSKVSIPSVRALKTQMSKFDVYINQFKSPMSKPVQTIEGITRLDFWFKPSVIAKLAYVRKYIKNISNDSVRLFFSVAFSETVRDTSNTRNGEFKLYRYDAAKLAHYDPDVFASITTKLARNFKGLIGFLEALSQRDCRPNAQVFDFNTVHGVPHDVIRPRSVDIVITSPPYGDSHTTVAYGQYSRLSAAWLELTDPDNIDQRLMGGNVGKEIPTLPSDELRVAVAEIEQIDKKRAIEVAAFYSDLNNSIHHVSNVIKPNGYACYVVGNRKVKGVVLPTDVAIRSMFECQGFSHVETFHRKIPNKRMPLRNSPTNIAGALAETMSREYIVVMKRQGVTSIKNKPQLRAVIKKARSKKTAAPVF